MYHKNENRRGFQEKQSNLLQQMLEGKSENEKKQQSDLVNNITRDRVDTRWAELNAM
jgi:hypothetical protein